jgi:hypothetical protein
MTFSVMVHRHEDLFKASLVGAPELRAVAPTRLAPLAALENVIVQRVEKGELISLEVGRK